MSHKANTHSSSHSSSQKRRGHRYRRTLTLLHLLVSIVTFPTIVVTIATVALWNANFFHNSGFLRGDWTDGLLLIPLSLSLSISLPQVVSACLNRKSRQNGKTKHGDYIQKRAVRPVTTFVPILATVTLLVLFIPLLILSGLSGLFHLWRPTSSPLQSSNSAGSPSSTLALTSTSTLSSLLTALTTSQISRRSFTAAHSSSQHCTLSQIFTRPCNPTIFTIGSLQIAIIALSAATWFLELLVLITQIKRHRYNKQKQKESLRRRARSLMDEKSSSHPAYRTRSQRSERGQSPDTFLTRPSPTKARSTPPLTRSISDASTSSSQSSNSSMTPRGPFDMRPKQYHYKPQISRSRSQREAEGALPEEHIHAPRNLHAAATFVETSGITDADRIAAVEEVRLKLRPNQSMGKYLATKYA